MYPDNPLCNCYCLSCSTTTRSICSRVHPCQLPKLLVPGRCWMPQPAPILRISELVANQWSRIHLQELLEMGLQWLSLFNRLPTGLLSNWRLLILVQRIQAKHARMVCLGSQHLWLRFEQQPVRGTSHPTWIAATWNGGGNHHRNMLLKEQWYSSTFIWNNQYYWLLKYTWIRELMYIAAQTHSNCW